MAYELTMIQADEADVPAVSVLPPGLDLPLPTGGDDECPVMLAMPPGLTESVADDAPMYVSSKLVPQVQKGVTVHVVNLPNRLLSDIMMQATLEQTQVAELVTSYVTKPGKPYGEAFVTLMSTDAAIQVVRHFCGRCWDSSGVTVDAWLVPSVGTPSPPPAATFGLKKGPKKVKPTYTPEMPASVSKPLSADAPTFVPSFSSLSPTSALSAEAPEFIPCMLKPVNANVMSSDVSTEDGEQTSDDEKAVAAHPTQC